MDPNLVDLMLRKSASQDLELNERLLELELAKDAERENVRWDALAEGARDLRAPVAQPVPGL